MEGVPQMHNTLALHGKGGKLRGKEKKAQRIKLAENESIKTDLCEAIDQGLRDIAKGDFVEIRRTHITDDVDKLFESFKED